MTNFRKRLLELAKGNEEYRDFNKKIVNTKKKTLGVRTPDMRNLAKTLANGMMFADISKFLKQANKDIYEEVSLAGLIITYAKISDAEKIKLTKEYLKYADSWALVDVFVSRWNKFDEKLWWDFATSYLDSKKEFEARFGVIFLMANFLNDEYIDKVFKELHKVKNDAYYVKMGLAWLYATAAVNYYDKTLSELKKRVKDPWTYKKSLQKMTESFRLTTKQKAEIKKLKKTL